MMVAGNWKMNKTAAEAVTLTRNLKETAKKCGKDVDVVIAPPFTAIHSVATVMELDKVPVGLGAQNMFFETEGAFTGEISPRMLLAERVMYVIVGHSERREYFGETDELVNRKVKAVLEHDMIPIICCGESLEIREDEETGAWISEQITQALTGLLPEHVAKSVIAYEPIWAIGTGKTATPEMAQEVCAMIRALVTDMFDEVVASQVRILYGGSVNEHNAHVYFGQIDIDGALVGGAALDADSFIKIIKAAC
jgi:triosephosphate isomerase